MNRPPLEVADIIRSAGESFVGTEPRVDQLAAPQGTAGHPALPYSCARRSSRSLLRLRSRTAISYNSCGNRHCPKCQGNARLRWLEAREGELLPTRYVHAVFTLPRELAPVALQNKKVIFNLLFHASAQTLLEVARRSSASRSGDRLLQRAAHLGSTVAVSSACSLCPGRWRARSRS